MTKLFLYTLIFFILMSFAGCINEDCCLSEKTFFKEFPSDTNIAAVGIAALDDGNFVMAAYEYHSPTGLTREPGRMIKFDAGGKVLWNKKLTMLGRTLFKILPVPGKGFITFGIGNDDSYQMDICLYSNNGDSLSSHKVYSNGHNSWMAPYDIIRLSNGNYAVGGGEEYKGKAYLTILSPDFDSLSGHSFNPPPGYSKFVFHGFTETTDGSLALTAETDHRDAAGNVDKNLIVFIRADLSGVQKSYEFIYDSLYDETSNAAASYSKGLFAITARKRTDNTGDGTQVNYTYNYNRAGLLISGIINIDLFTNEGRLQDRKVIANYPGNGIINSLHKTSDGGFIACGTVNQANSPVLVSDTKIYLLKLDANLDVQWRKIIPTLYPAFGIDALPAPDGSYFICAYQRSKNQRYEMLAIKTDANGNL